MTTTQNKDKKKSKKPTKTEKLKKEIDELKEELKQKNDKLIRIIADFQNYQKRTNKEIESKQQEIRNKYISELLDLKELINNALNDDNPKDGLRSIIKQIENFFEKENIRPINCIGEKFDHKYHHAVTIIEKEDCEDETIIEEIKKGFMMNEQLVRPSQVIVSKKKEKK